MNIHSQPVAYHGRLEKRDPGAIGLVVLHCTELPSLREAREYAERILYPDSGTGACGHYYIDRDGSVVQYVEDDRIANHVIGHNRNSIGIEIVNSGRYPDWYATDSQTPVEEYTSAQLDALRDLLRDLKQRIPSLTSIARHSDLDTTLVPASDDPAQTVRRKIDPGPRFPWDSILAFWQTL